MAISREDLFARLDRIGAAHETMTHRAVFTVDEGRDLKAKMPGGHSKNLFLKDKKGALFLVTAHADAAIDLVALGKEIGAKGRMSFGKAALMEDVLGVSPGSVTPFAVANAAPPALSAVIVDQRFFEFDTVWFHPLENTASTAIAPGDLVAFLEDCGYAPLVMALPEKTTD